MNMQVVVSQSTAKTTVQDIVATRVSQPAPFEVRPSARAKKSVAECKTAMLEHLVRNQTCHSVLATAF